MYSVDKDYFKCIDTPEKAYWLGFLMVDGCVLEYRNRNTGKLKAMGLQLNLSKIDSSHIELFKSCVKSEAPITYPKAKCGDTICDTTKIVICCTNMYRDLIEHGCVPRKSLILKFPNIDELNGFESSFIRGYLDGDGSVSFTIGKQIKETRKPTYSFYCNILGTDLFLDSLNDVLSKSGIIAYKKMYKINTPELRLFGRQNLLKFFEYLYSDNSECYLKRKYDKFVYAFNYFGMVP